MVEDPLISFQCAIMATHNAIILNVHDPIIVWISICKKMAWQWAETLVEIRGTVADIWGTTK